MKQAPTLNAMTVAGTATEVQTAWVAWLELVSDDERAVVADILDKHELGSLPSINAFAKDVMVAIFRGQLSPTVAAAAKPWLDMICVNVHAMHSAQGTDGREEIIRGLIEIRRNHKQLQPMYTAPMRIESTDVMPSTLVEREMAAEGDFEGDEG